MFGSPIFLGIDVEEKRLKLARLKKVKDKIKIINLLELPKEGHLQQLSTLSKESLVASSLSPADVLVRGLKLPIKKEREIAASLQFQAETLLPYPAREGLTAYEIIEKNTDSTQISLFATKKECFNRALEGLSLLGIYPDIVTAPFAALAKLAYHCNFSERCSLIAYLKENEGFAILARKGKVLAARAFEIENSEIQKTFFSLASPAKEEITSLYILGDESHKELLESATKLKVQFLQGFDLPFEKMQEFGLAIGYALSSHDQRPNFQSKISPRFFRRWQRPLAIAGVLSLLLTCSFTFFSHAYFKEKEALLVQKSEKLFNLVEKDGSPKNITSLEEALFEANEKIDSKKSSFPLLPLVPKASDILAWLVSSSSSNELSFRVEEFHYKMVNKPDFAHKNEKYLIKVELLLSATDAYLLQELILEKNPFLDPSKEKEWKRLEEGKFRTSFYLKDKTRYSS